MAGDWIKMRANLDTHPKVVTLASTLSTSELHVIGMLWKVWAWADQHSLDGNAVSVTESFLDRMTSATGFAVALRKVGWLDGRDGSLSFPRFAEHNGRTAKTREETNARVARHRATKKRECNADDVTKSVTREEKRREDESSNEDSNARAGPASPKFVCPTVDQVREYCRERGNAVDPGSFVDFYTSKGWKVGREPMKDWKACIRTWEKRDAHGRHEGTASQAHRATPAGGLPAAGQRGANANPGFTGGGSVADRAAEIRAARAARAGQAEVAE